ncbi:MAG: ABC transporter ATP-binding protein [Beijerinckiaceae bacterium]|nr:ABC transporter ATP-binding protein [Beijerinckiaceae bacterium]
MSIAATDARSQPALAFRNLTLGYDRHPAVHHLSGAVASGALLAVVGPNGAGKSTLLKSIVGTLVPLEGSIDRSGLRAQDIAYLPQSAEIDRTFPITVYDLVSMGHWRRIGMFGRLSRGPRDPVAEAIDAVGLRGFEARALGTLSGGQMQRVLFARLLLQDARLILLDEPFTAIDAKTTSDLIDLIARWHGEKRTVIAVLHDMGIVREHFPETLLLAREAVAWGPTGETLSSENLLRARRMVEAFSHQADICDKVA